MARFGSLDTQYFDDAGDPLVSGKIYFYESGTTTPKATYADVNYTIANSNPVILTAAGRQPNIFFEGVAKAILTKSDNTQILVRDPVGDTASTFGNAWIASKDYNANDVVQGSDGEFYVSLINGNVNNNPVTTTGSWTFLYSVEWNAGTTYKLGSVVTYQTIVYQSLQNSNLNQNPSSATTYWVPIQLVWSSTTTYAINANVVGTDGILYTSLQNANTNHIPASSPSWWVGTSAAAASSASAAATSASNAASSASAASTSASNAATSESNAAASASTASTQATNASNYAAAASTSATNAANSASAASTSASNAAASYDLFDDRYLGAKSSDPTVDNDGDPLVTGAMYFNTVSNTTRIYNGSGWQDSAAIATSINLSTQVTGTLAVANGGTGATSLTASAYLKGNGTSAITAQAGIPAGDITSGTLAVARGGTGLTALGTANQVLKVNSGATALEYGSVASSSIQEFTSSGTWTKPSGANFVMVEALGGGGGGGSGQIAASGTDQWGGCGGGGGAYVYRVFNASELPSSVVVTVGAGGTGGAAKTGTNESGAAGTAGGNSSFGNLLVAYRGAGGPGGSSSQDGGIGGGVLGTGGQPSNNGGNVTSGTFQGAFGAGGGEMGNSAARTYSSGFGGGSGGGQGLKGGTVNSGAAGGGSYQGGAGGGGGGMRSSLPQEFTAGQGGTYFNGDSGGVPVGRYGVAANGFLPRLGGGGGRLKETVASASFNAIAYGDSKFVATNSDSAICVSSDNGATWTLQASSPLVTSPRIFYLNGQWCFLTSTRLAVSSNLSSYTVSIINNGNALGYYGGTYVLVGSSGTIQTSTDLTTWVVRTSGTSEGLNDVIHDGTRWIAVGSNGVSLTSTDAITWTLVTTASSGNWSRVASSGSVLVATSSVSPYAWRSTNAGATWAGVSTTLTAGSNGRVIYAGSQFVFCSASDVWTSASGDTWTQQTDGLADTYVGVAYSGSAYAICSSANNSTVGITSPTGVTWTQRTFSSTNFNNTAGGNGGIAAGGGGGSAALNGDTGGSGAGGNGGNGLVRVYTW